MIEIELEHLTSEDACSYCEDPIVGNIEDRDLPLALGGKPFATVTFSNLLEHLYEPSDPLKKARPFHREDGALIANIVHDAF